MRRYLLIPALLLVACSTSSSRDSSDTTDDALRRGRQELSIAIGEDKKFSVPAFGGDVDRYDDVTVHPGDAIELVNESDNTILVVIAFDGPPMIAQQQERHSRLEKHLAAHESYRWRADAYNGRYSFLCPNANDESAACAGVTLDPSVSNPDWVPRLSVE